MDNLIRLYESTEKAFTSGGLGCLSDATSCVVSEERNGEYELELEYPINGIHYSELSIRRIILCPPNPYDRPQPFRIYSISKPIKGIVTVNAAHISYDLNNYVCFPFIAQSSAEVFERLNGGHSASETSRIYPEDILYNSMTNPYGFRFETDMIVNFPPKSQSQKPEPEDERFKVLIPKPIRTVLGTNDDCILGRFINSNGRRGEYFFDRFNVYLKDPNGNNPRGTDRGFEIRYGKNMTDVEKEETTKDDYTHIMPFWKAVQSTDTTVAVLGGEGVAPVVQVPGSSGRSDVKIKIVDLSSEFDKAPTATKLTQYAQDFIHDNELTGQSKVSITVNFQSLARSSEYEAYAALEDVRLCDTVKVIYEALGIVDEKKVIRYDYNVLKESYDEIEIGDPREELANTLAKTSSTAANTQSAGETIKNGLVETITNAIKLSQTVYYLDTTDRYDEDNPPDPPSDWVHDATGDANKWTNAEPVLDTDGELFTYSQNRLTDDTINISDFNFSKLASTVRSWVTGDNNDEINGESLANSSVKTNAVNDEAITSAKLAVDAVQSRTYTAGSDAHFSQTGTLINLARTGYIRSKNFAIDSSGNAYFKGQVTATSGYIGSEQSGFLISDSALTGTYLSGNDSYYVNMETDGTLMMRPVEFSPNSKYTSSLLDEANFRMSAYHPDIGFHDQIDIYSSQDGMGIGFFVNDSTLSTSTAVEQFAIGGQHRTELGGIYASPENGNVTTTGEWVLSGDTYLAGHPNQTLKAWIEAIEASGYVLPPATTSTLGGVIVGSNLSVAANGTLSVNTNTIATRAWVTWDNLGSKPFATIGTSSGLKVDSGHNLVINYGTGLTTNNSDQLVVDTSTIATRTWVGQQGYLTSVTWSQVNNKPFSTIGYGLTVASNVALNVLITEGETGIKLNTDGDGGLELDYTVVARQSDIRTYTGEKGITVSSANKVGHTNTYTAKTTQALYPIKIDTYGHISAVGDAVTIPTIPGADRGISLVNSKYGHSNTAITQVSTQGLHKLAFDAYGHITGYTTYTLLNGLELDSNNRLNVVLQASNSGLLFDDDGNHGLAIDPTYVALKSDIPTVNNATLTIQRNGTTVKTFTANASSNVTANITVPTKTSDLTNDSGFITGVSWANVGSKPFDNIGDDGLTVVTTNNVKYLKVLLAESGAGLTFDSEGNHGLMIDSTVALKTDIPTYTGEKGITVSNAHAVGHTNTYTAKTTQAVYPIKIDTYGHISAVGSAVTIPTITLNGSATTSPSFYAPTGAGTSGQYLKSSGTGAPTWANFPTIPTVNNATLTIQKNGTNVATFTANASSNVTANITIGWSDVNDKPFSTILASSGLKVDSSKNLCINYGTGLTTNNSDQLTVDFTEVATAGHTHTTSIAAGGTSQLNLSANTVYTLTAGGTNFVFKTPADNNTATAADNILDGSNSGTQITYAPYSATTATSTWVGTDGNAGKLYLGTQAPSKTTRLNYNGYLYATKLYSGGTEVSVSGHTHAWSDITTGKPFSTVNEDHGLEVSSDSLQVKDGTGLKINSESGELEVAFGATATTVAAGNHTHTATIAADTGTSALDMSANTKYKLTAGGSTFIFKTPADANSYHTTGSWSGLTYTATANGGAGALAFTIPTGTTSTTVSKGNHTHDISIEATGSDPVSLSANTTYTLTAGGKSLVIKTPADANTATAADNILDGSNSGTQITYAPYSATTATSTWVGTDGNAGKLYLGTQAPSKTTRLNYNGYLYATKLYSGGTEVSVSGHTHAWSAITTGKPFDQVDEDKGLEIITSSSVKYLGIKLSADLKFDSESGEVTHTNSVTAQTTQALYPIKIDAKGHISAYGTAVTVPSASSTVTAVSTTASAGSASTYSKGDHTHNISLATGDSNGQVKIAGTNVSVKGLGAMAYKASVAFSDLPTLYWANVAVASASATNKSPQFADMTATNVKLYASSAVKATMTYNTTTDAIDFNFA